MAKTKENRALLLLPEDFRKKCDEIVHEPYSGKLGLMKHKYHMGFLVKDAYALQMNSPCVDILDILRERFNLSTKRELDRVYLLINLFTWDEIEEIMEPADDGYTVGWGHFNFVMVDYLDKEQMIEYLQRSKQEHIGSQDMYHIIQKEHNRVKDPQNRKQMKSASQFVDAIHEYMDFCAERDIILGNAPLSIIQKSVQVMKPSDREDLIKQLDDHLMSCFMLKRKLQG